MKLVIALMLVGVIAQAESLVKFEGTSAKVAGVEVFPTVKVKLPAGEETLEKSGAGIRKKTKASVLTFEVYVAASYVKDLKALRGADAIAGLKDQKAKVLRLTMLRGLSAADIKDSFKTSLELNKVDLDADAVKAIFSAWKSDVKKGDTITLIGYPTEKDGDQLFIEVNDKTLSSKGKDLSLDFWKIWFGKGDDWIVELQKQLIGKE